VLSISTFFCKKMPFPAAMGLTQAKEAVSSASQLVYI
jgi:hypothetical protein